MPLTKSSIAFCVLASVACVSHGKEEAACTVHPSEELLLGAERVMIQQRKNHANFSMTKEASTQIQAFSNVAFSKPVTTTLDNTFRRNIKVITDSTVEEQADVDAFSSTSASGSITIHLLASYEIQKVILYWSGWWGAGTNGFKVVLKNGNTQTTAYETSTASQTVDRVDELDLVSMGTAGYADTIIVECLQRTDAGYALLEIEAMSSTVPASNYVRLSNSGSCGLEPYSFPEFCSCHISDVPNLNGFCKQQCDLDYSCPGYSEGGDMTGTVIFCDFITFSPCPAVCRKRAVGAWSGPLVPIRRSQTYYGCIKKEQLRGLYVFIGSEEQFEISTVGEGLVLVVKESKTLPSGKQYIISDLTADSFSISEGYGWGGAVYMETEIKFWNGYVAGRIYR